MPAIVIGIRLTKITMIIAELKYKKSTFADTAKNKRYICVIEQNHTRRDNKNRIRILQGLWAIQLIEYKRFFNKEHLVDFLNFFLRIYKKDTNRININITAIDI